MANSYTRLADLRAGRCSNTVEVRLLRFWEARNTKKGGDLSTCSSWMNMWLWLTRFCYCNRLWCLFRLLQLIISTQYSRRLSMEPWMRPAARRTDKISMRDSFTLLVDLMLHVATTISVCLIYALVPIRFGEGIRFTQVTDSDKVIPTEMFRFQSYDQLLALANTDRQLPGLLFTFSKSNYLTVLDLYLT